MPSTPTPPPVAPSPVTATPSAPSAAAAAPPVSHFDPAPIINAQEQNLADYLNLPVQDILDRLGLAPLPSGAAPPDMPMPAGQPGPVNPMDPSSLIQPVTDALGTLGTGMFDKLDPSKMFEGISKAFESAGSSVQQALGSLEGIWSGASGASAATKTGETLANGAEVATQSAGLGTNVSTTVADVKQAETRLLEIINEYNAKIAAIGPNIIFPWGQAQAVEAATQATTMTTECITELQSTLSAQAGEAAAIGAPVALTEAPQVGMQAIGPMLQMATGLISPMMQVATQGLSMGTQAVTGAVQTGVQTATSLASGLSQAATGAADPAKAATGVPSAPTSKLSGTGGAVPGGGGGGAPASGVAPTRALAPATMTPPESTASPTQANAVRAASASAVGGGMGAGGGMMGAGHGAGKSGVDGQGHNAASFLHTSDQGDAIVGDLGNVAPPVIGEADPNDSPDIELRV